MRLHLYFAWKFLRTFIAIFVAFAIFTWLIELLEHIRRFDSGDVSFGTLVYLSILHLPEVLYQIQTLVVLLATVAMFINLARTSELVVIRAAGRSAIRALAAPALVAGALGMIAVGVFNPMVARLSKHYETAENRIRGSERVVSISREGLWLRQGLTDRQTAIRAVRANLDGTMLYDVSFFGFDGEGTPLYRAEAASAELTEGAWVLTNVKRWQFDAENPEASSETFERFNVTSDLTRDQIRDSFGTPSSIPFWDLHAFIERLELAGFSARLHRVWFQSELARPLAFIAMVMIGAVFTLRHTRMGRTGLMVLFAVLSGFAVYFVASLARVMAESGQIPVLLAIWSPHVAAICMAFSLLLHFEDG